MHCSGSHPDSRDVGQRGVALMLDLIRLSRLSAQSPIVDTQGRPTPLFMRYFNDVLGQLEKTINGVIDAQTAAATAQAQADLAQDQAIDAIAQAVAAQATADGKLSAVQADALYVKQDATPDWVAPTGTTDRGGFVSYAAPTISATPTQAEVQAVANAVQDASRHLAALVGDLITVEALKG